MDRRDIIAIAGVATGASGISYGVWQYFRNRPDNSSQPPKSNNAPPKTQPPSPPNISVSGVEIFVQGADGGMAHQPFGKGTLVNVPERWSYAFIGYQLTNLSTKQLNLVIQAHIEANGKTLLTIPPSSDHAVTIPGRTTQNRRLSIPSSYLSGHVLPNAGLDVVIDVKDLSTQGVKTFTFKQALFARPF